MTDVQYFNGSVQIPHSPTSVVLFTMTLNPSNNSFKWMYAGLADTPEEYDWRAESYSLTGSYQTDPSNASLLTFTVTGGKQEIQSSGLSYRVDQNYRPRNSFEATLDGNKMTVKLFSSELVVTRGDRLRTPEGLILPDYIFG